MGSGGLEFAPLRSTPSRRITSSPPEHREEIELVPKKRVPEVGREHGARHLVDEASATRVEPNACCSGAAAISCLAVTTRLCRDP